MFFIFPKLTLPCLLITITTNNSNTVGHLNIGAYAMSEFQHSADKCAKLHELNKIWS